MQYTLNFMYYYRNSATFCFLVSLKPASVSESESVRTASVPFFFPFHNLPLASSLLLAHFGEGLGHGIALADRSRHWGLPA